MSVAALTSQSPIGPYSAVALSVAHARTAVRMLVSVMGVAARAPGESASRSAARTAQKDERAVACNQAHRLGPRTASPCPLPHASGPKGGEWRGAGPHLGRPAKAEMAGGEARKSRRDRNWVERIVGPGQFCSFLWAEPHVGLGDRAQKRQRREQPESCSDACTASDIKRGSGTIGRPPSRPVHDAPSHCPPVMHGRRASGDKPARREIATATMA